MIHYIDARGKQCPIPVVETKKVLAHVRPGDIIETAVDNEIAVQNLEKMAVQKKLAFSHRTEGERHYVVSLSMTAEGGKDRDTNGENTSGAEAAGEKEEFLCRPCVQGETVVVLSSDKMGEGDEALGKVLCSYKPGNPAGYRAALQQWRQTFRRRIRFAGRSETAGIPGGGDPDLRHMPQSLRSDGKAGSRICDKYV